MYLYYLPVVILGIVGWCMLRISSWKGQEAAFWRQINLQVRFDPPLEQKYMPYLIYKRAHPVGKIRMIRGWEDPVTRFNKKEK